jgi:transposase
MTHFVGLDASKATTNICILDAGGGTVREGVVSTEPSAIIQYLRGERRRYRRVGIESMSFTPWLYEPLAAAGLPVICIESAYASAVLSGRLNKTDRNDARGIAEIMRAGVYKAVHIKTKASQEAKLLLSARGCLIAKRCDIDNVIRSALLQFGLKIAPGRTYSFEARAQQLAPSAGAVRAVLESLLVSRASLDSEVAKLEQQIDRLVADDPVCQRLMTAPGVGRIAALEYRAAVDVPQRFSSSRTVGVHLGLTPRTFKSGTVDRKGRISKCGDPAARKALYLAAMSLVRPATRTSDLKVWGLKVIAERGRRKGVIAVARRLAVILHRMWLDETDFRFELNASASTSHEATGSAADRATPVGAKPRKVSRRSKGAAVSEAT